jgi:excisionase family DNA binding protein
VILFPKKNAPWRRVVRTVRIAERQLYDELECGHRESHDYTAKKRRCRTCAHPTFPGILTAPRNPTAPKTSAAGDAAVIATAPAPATTRSRPVSEVLTVEEVAQLLRLNKKTVYQAAACGEIPGARRIGRVIRFYGPALAKWLETGAGTRGRRAAGRSGG